MQEYNNAQQGRLYSANQFYDTESAATAALKIHKNTLSQWMRLTKTATPVDSR